MNAELFPAVAELALAPGALLLSGFALDEADALLAAVNGVMAEAPLRRLHTPGGQLMQVAMSNCGELGWVSDARGYRYQALDPQSGRRWPAMPDLIKRLAGEAARRAGLAERARHFSTVQELAAHLQSSLRENDLVLVKASRGMALEEIAAGIAG